MITYIIGPVMDLVQAYWLEGIVDLFPPPQKHTHMHTQRHTHTWNKWNNWQWKGWQACLITGLAPRILTCETVSTSISPALSLASEIERTLRSCFFQLPFQMYEILFCKKTKTNKKTHTLDIFLPVGYKNMAVLPNIRRLTTELMTDD